MSTPAGPAGTTAQPAYPLTPPGRDDARFTVGLVIDVATVLHRHGYPPLHAGADLTRLQHALFTAIYRQGAPT